MYGRSVCSTVFFSNALIIIRVRGKSYYCYTQKHLAISDFKKFNLFKLTKIKIVHALLPPHTPGNHQPVLCI